MKKALLVLTLATFAASAGTALAVAAPAGSYPGTGPFPGTPITIARETFTAGQTFLLPSGTAGEIFRQLNVIPQLTTTSPMPYQVEVNIGSTLRTNPQPGAIFVPTGGSLSAVAMTISDGGSCTGTGVLVLASSTEYRWNVTFNAPCTTFPIITVTFSDGVNNVDVQDGRGAGLNLQSNIDLKSEIYFIDQATGLEFPTDVGNEQFRWITSAYASGATETATTAIIDVTTPSLRTLFLNGGPGGDTTTQDNGASVTLENIFTYYDWPATTRGSTFSPNTGATNGTKGFYNVTLSTVPLGRDFTGLAAGSPTIGGHPTGGTLTSRNWSFSNAESAVNTTYAIVSTITGAIEQQPGSFTLAIDYYNGTCGGASGTTCTGVGTLVHAIMPSFTYTTWSLNGTVLYSPFISGNTTAFMQRFYICAPLSSVDSPSFEVVITTVPVDGTASGLLWKGTVNSTLRGGGCINIRMEDLMTTAGIAQPYNTDGGNLAIEMTFPAPNVIGLHQTTNNPTLGQPSSFVTAPMVRLNRTVHFGSNSLLIDPGL